MKVVLKLYASLGQYLPEGARDHKAELEVSQGVTPNQLLEQHRVPDRDVHLVLVNGVYIPPSGRDTPLNPGDELAVWPAIAGG